MPVELRNSTVEDALRSHQNLPSAPHIIKSVQVIDHKSTMSTKLCSACGEKSDALMKCRACKCVWYCDKDCQNRHWKEHKKECKPIKKALGKRGGKLDIGTENEVGPLGKLPPQEECPICMRMLPLHDNLRMYANCCGKTFCGSCDLQHDAQTQIKNAKRAKMQQPPVPRACAFCREPISKSDEESLALTRKRVEDKDPRAFFRLAMDHGYGRHGLPVDHAKCIDLLRQSAGLGFPVAHYQLGNFYQNGDRGLEQNEEEALKHWDKAAEGGYLNARHNVGCIVANSGDAVAAMRHFRLSASGGLRVSMAALIAYFEQGSLRHGDLAETLQAMYLARAELSSKDRKKYIEHLKKTGEYDEGCDV